MSSLPPKPPDQRIDDVHLLLGQAEHHGALVLGGIHALIGRPDGHDILVVVKVGDRALGLHEGVLGEGRLIVLGDHVLGPRDRAVRVAALQALVGQDVAAAVDKRRALLHGRMRVKDRRFDVILHPDELFGLLDGLQALAAHEGDGVAQVMRVAENRDPSHA